MKRILSIICIVCAIVTLLISSSVFVSANNIVTPALSVLSYKAEMTKSCLMGNELDFSVKDFENFLGTKNISCIKLLSLPSVTEGKLMLGNLRVVNGQTISGNNIKNMYFVPDTNASCESSFRFSINGNDSEAFKCSMFILSDLNFAPTAGVINPSYLNVSTQKNISYYGTLKAIDPEGDRVTYRIVSDSKKGFLTLNSESGSYCYTPSKNYVGQDSFKYIAQDKYGNTSEPVTVTVDISKAASDVIFTDMVGHWAHNAAIKVSAANIMRGTTVGNSHVFNPSGMVSRAEFLYLAMKATDVSVDGTVNKTVFSDDDDIPAQYKPYIAKAYEMGIIKGMENESGIIFDPNSAIKKAEAAVILKNLLNVEKPSYKPVFADSSNIPDWAESAIYSMNELGIFEGNADGNMAPFSELDRAMTAQILCSVLGL